MNPKLDAPSLTRHVHVRVQMRQNPAKFYTTAELADAWHCSPHTIRTRLWKLKRKGLGPTPGQLVMFRRNPYRRFRLIRADYALFMQEHYLHLK